MDFNISLAGVNIGIHSIYDAIYNMCSEYLTDQAAQFNISSSQADIDFEREKSIAEARYEGRPFIEFSPDYLETLAIYRKIATEMLRYNAFLMHGAVVAQGGGATLFTAPSGVGKTTHTGFWLQKYPDAFIVNGDKPLLRILDGKVYACGTPWAGKEGKNRNVMLPLKSICALFRGSENQIRRITFSDIFPLIISQTYRPGGQENMKKTLELIKELGRLTKFYVLACNLDPDAARVAKEGMDADE